MVNNESLFLNRNYDLIFVTCMILPRDCHPIVLCWVLVVDHACGLFWSNGYKYTIREMSKQKNDNECDECDNFGKWERKSSELLLLLGPNFIHFPVSEK